MGDRIEKLYARWAMVEVNEDDVHAAIDELLIKARLVQDDDGAFTEDVSMSDGIHEQRIAILDVLADLTGIEPEYTGPWHVVKYDVTREYGGPEEGGWWYDWYANPVLISTTPEDYGAASLLKDELNKLAKKEREEDGRMQGRYSVLGGADEVYVVEKTVGESESTERPHYE